MDIFDPLELKELYRPSKISHKGQNGKLTIIGGSHLFHGASLWALKVTSRIVDMVFYSSIPENNELTKELKSELYDFIAVPRGKIEEYIEESDCILIGPGMVRTDNVLSIKYQVSSMDDIDKISDEGIQTYYITKYFLKRYPKKKWVIDAGSLQMMEPEWLRWLGGNVVITPHPREFEGLFHAVMPNSFRHPQKILNQVQDDKKGGVQDDIVRQKAKEYNCVILLKGPTDIVCSPSKCVSVEGGNEGMTKGGTGDVLAGFVAALACKNDLFLAAACASFINKKAGDELYKRVGPYFNASDLADEIPKIMKSLLYFPTSPKPLKAEEL